MSKERRRLQECESVPRIACGSQVWGRGDACPQSTERGHSGAVRGDDCRERKLRCLLPISRTSYAQEQWKTMNNKRVVLDEKHDHVY